MRIVLDTDKETIAVPRNYAVKLKKLIALLLAAVMCLSFAACGGSAEDGSKTSDSDMFPVGVWVSLYSGGTLTLNSDNTMSIGSNSGTWSLTDSCLTLKYTTQKDGSSMERYYNIVEENGYKLLRGQLTGKVDGSTVNFSQNEYYSEDDIGEIKRSVSKVIGDTVSTDILELSVNSVELSYYAAGASTSTSDGRTVNVDEACSPLESGGFYTANKGRTLVCLDFTLTNTDRSSLNTGDYIVSFSVKQNDDYAIVRGYDLNNADGSYGLNLWNMPISTNGKDFITNKTSNIIISAGETDRIKYVGIIGFDADLSGSFELVAEIKNSDGAGEKFIYTIEK